MASWGEGRGLAVRARGVGAGAAGIFEMDTGCHVPEEPHPSEEIMLAIPNEKRRSQRIPL